MTMKKQTFSQFTAYVDNTNPNKNRLLNELSQKFNLSIKHKIATQREFNSVPIINGDMLKSNADIIIQQVNCVNIMGGYLAKSIYEAHPKNKDKYHEFIKTKYNQGLSPSELLGSVLMVPVKHDNKARIIANVFGQENIRQNKYDKTQYTVMSALHKGLSKVARYAKENNLSVAIPFNLGAGVANGVWDDIQNLINQTFDDCTHLVSIYKYEPQKKYAEKETISATVQTSYEKLIQLQFKPFERQNGSIAQTKTQQHMFTQIVIPFIAPSDEYRIAIANQLHDMVNASDMLVESSVKTVIKGQVKELVLSLNS